MFRLLANGKFQCLRALNHVITSLLPCVDQHTVRTACSHYALVADYDRLDGVDGVDDGLV